MAKVDVINSDSCDELLKWRRNRNWQGLTDHQICAGYLPGGIDTCQVSVAIKKRLYALSYLAKQLEGEILVLGHSVPHVSLKFQDMTY